MVEKSQAKSTSRRSCRRVALSPPPNCHDHVDSAGAYEHKHSLPRTAPARPHTRRVEQVSATFLGAVSVWWSGREAGGAVERLGGGQMVLAGDGTLGVEWARLGGRW